MNRSLIVLSLLLALNVSLANGAVISFTEDFSSDASISMNWTINPYNMSYPSGWVHSYSGGDLYTDDLIGIQNDDWVYVGFTYQLPYSVTDNFALTMNISWDADDDSTPPSQLNQNLFTVSLQARTATGQSVALASYYDIYNNSPAKFMVWASASTGFVYSDQYLSHTGSGSLTLTRTDGALSVTATDGTIITTSSVTGNQLPVDSLYVQIRGRVANWDHYVGTAVLHDLAFTGENTAVPEPMTALLLAIGLIRFAVKKIRG